MSEKRLRDHIKLVPKGELGPQLRTLEQELTDAAAAITPFKQHGNKFQVFPAVLMALSRQIQVLRASESGPVEMAGTACRMALELNIQTRILIANSAEADLLVVDRLFEEISMLKALKGLQHESTDQAVIKEINGRIAHLRQLAAKRGVRSRPWRSVAEMAKSVGLKKEYENLYCIYSKYTHASPWLICANDHERDGDDWRNVFGVMAQTYALDALERIMGHLKFTRASPAESKH